jgi:YkoY family integral membrane protein
MTIANLLILFNVFILESLLSIDNAAVLAVMVSDLPFRLQGRALKYGILGAFIFRGLCLFVAAWLIQILWLKIAGGLYLLYLVYGHFTPKKDTIEEGIDKNKNKLYLHIKSSIGVFWSTVILVEIMDIAFSIDNIFAVVAMTNKITLIIIGVCLGIIAMRFVAQAFTILMKKYPSLENSAFIVIGILGLKLILSGILDYSTSFFALKTFIASHWFDISFSGLMLIIFIFPIIKLKHLKWLKR